MGRIIRVPVCHSEDGHCPYNQPTHLTRNGHGCSTACYFECYEGKQISDDDGDKLFDGDFPSWCPLEVGE